MDCGYGHGECKAPDTQCPHWQGTFCELDQGLIMLDCHKCVYEGLHGLPSWEDVRDELNDSYGPDEEPSDDDIREVYLDHRDNWLDYRVEKYEEGKDYE